MTDTAQNTSSPSEPKLLGPFLGYVTSHSIKIWLHLEGERRTIYVSLHAENVDAPQEAAGALNIRPEALFTDCITMEGLRPDTRYFYKLWTNPAHSLPLDLQGLTEKDLQFRTLSEDTSAQIDFLLMSCHNPTVSGVDGFDGHAVWADLPQIISRESNKCIRFALLVGDQVYADDWEKRVLAEPNADARLRLYLSAYRRFWSNIHYRRVMCSLPAVMMWDDHDITDGWGSRIDSYVGETSEFKPEWKRLFESAFQAFSLMQASRNPPTLARNPKDGLDFCFRIGPWGFIFMDLRTNRNLRRGRVITADQAARIRNWVDSNRREMHTVFVASSVVFSHGSPVVEDLTLTIWPYVMRLVAWIAGKAKWGKGLQTRFDKSLGDISDDIKDSWGSKENAGQADLVLDYLFGLQNDRERPLGIVILSGDIHTSGYANIYSSDVAHVERSSIPHITSSSVSYSPFHWLMEAVYRHASKTVGLGAKGVYSSQISHHFCSRSAAVISIRPTRNEDDYQLKVKYYLEGFPEPQILLFDLSHTSHRENIAWVAQEALFEKDYAPTANVDVESLMRDRAKEAPENLNWQESIVDMMKLLNMDSSLGARKKLAQQWGYTGSLNGSADMNIWLHQQVMQRVREAGGGAPDRGGGAVTPAPS
jgi:phosphodiesterase/alkaline phosphatase D-like protein